MSFDLRDVLTEEDKLKIKNYLWMYGVNKEIDVEKWLEDWAESNITLYHLLGEKLMYKIPYSCEIPKPILEKKMSHLVMNSRFLDDIYDYFCMKDAWAGDKDTEDFSNELIYFVKRIMRSKEFFTNKVSDQTFKDDAKNLKYKDEKTGKVLSFQTGMKTIKAIRMLVNFIIERDPEYAEKNHITIQEFEQFRIDHSMILNDAREKGNLCLSIHPLDYMTMSDNDSNWTSCMNWRNSGCYHTGTVEMMNSEYVVCCYLESTNHDFNFYTKNNNSNIREEDCVWNNKKWRILAIVTKDIIASIKGYPYQNEIMSKDIVNELSLLAGSNLNWKYDIPLDEYVDMKDATVADIEEEDYFFEVPEDAFLFRTKGMYNDMAHDAKVTYYCVRNKSNKRKTIDISGSCHCAICQNQILTINEDWLSYEDDKYNNTDTILCEDCRKGYKCFCCGEAFDYENLHGSKTISVDLKNPLTGEVRTIQICTDCAKNRFTYCEHCGKLIFCVDGLYRPSLISVPYDETLEHFNKVFFGHKIWMRIGVYSDENYNPFLLNLCYDCMKKKEKSFNKYYYNNLGKLTTEEAQMPVYVYRRSASNEFDWSNFRRSLPEDIKEGETYELGGSTLNLFEDEIDWEDNMYEV